MELAQRAVTSSGAPTPAWQGAAQQQVPARSINLSLDTDGRLRFGGRLLRFGDMRLLLDSMADQHPMEDAHQDLPDLLIRVSLADLLLWSRVAAWRNASADNAPLRLCGEGLCAQVPSC